MRITIDADQVSDPGQAVRSLAKRRNRAVERVTGGLTACLGWGAAMYFLHWHWMAFPLLFAGLLPLVSGLKELVALRLEAPSARRLSEGERRAETERAILRLARSRGGRVTPALAAIETSLSMEEAQAALDSMASRGHASLRILESGRIEYEFPEFLD